MRGPFFLSAIALRFLHRSLRFCGTSLAVQGISGINWSRMHRESALSLHRLRADRRLALLWLLLAGLFVRGLIAPGYMPQIGPEGVSIVLCTPAGAKTVWLADEMADHAAQQDQSCPFALALGLAGFAASAPTIDLWPESEQAVAPPAAALPRRIERTGSARGPPIHS